MKPTVHDIARVASVSLATVDRVLNDRPGVRPKTRDRVLEAMNSLGYIRDVGAANLARGRIYKFDFILPDNDNTFMVKLRNELAQTADHARADRIVINPVLIPAFDEHALVDALDDASNSTPDGVAFVAIDTEPVRAAARRLHDAGVQAVTLISDLTGSSRPHYVGVDNRAAGRTAGRLLGLFARNTEGAIAVIAGSLKVRDHQERFDGFVESMREDFPTRVILPVIEGYDEDNQVSQLVKLLLNKRQDIAAIYSVGAGNRGLVSALNMQDIKRRPLVIAHECDEAALQALHQGLFHAVLAQDAGHEVRSAVRVLKALADGSPIIAGQEHIRIEIFLKDNLPDFA